MPIYYDKDHKTYYCKFRYHDWTGKLRQTTKRGFIRKGDASQYERDFIREKQGSSGLLFSCVIDKYLEYLKAHIRLQSYNNANDICRLHIRPYFGDINITDISVRTIIDWHDRILLPAHYSPIMTRMINGRLSSVFNFAKKYYGFPTNPVPLAGPVGSMERVTNMSIWTPEQFKKFVTTIKPEDEKYKMLFTVLFWTGARPCEAMALTPEDVDYDVGIIHINKSLHYERDGKYYYTKPKNKSSVRDIMMPKFLIEEMQEYLNKWYNKKNTELIFPCVLNSVRKILKRYTTIAGLPQIRLYNLRHSHASFLVNSNQPLIAVAERMGHKDTNTTLAVYSHLYKNSRQQIVDFLDDEQKKECVK